MDPSSVNTVAGYRPLAELIPAHWESTVLDRPDGAHLHYLRTGGEKPALLLLHGVQSAGYAWLRVAKALEATYDVIMPDIRSHGKSTRLDANLPKDVLVADLQALLETLAITKPLIVGHSMGADLAGRLAARLPTAQGVVLVDPAFRNIAATMPTDREPPPWMASMFEAMQLLRSQPHPEKMQTGLRLLPPGAPLWGEEDYVPFIEAMAQFDPSFFHLMGTQGYLVEEPAVIAAVACPMLLLSARPMMPTINNEAGIAAFRDNWRQGSHVHFADSGHFIHIDQFDRFIDVVHSFVSAGLAEQAN